MVLHIRIGLLPCMSDKVVRFRAFITVCIPMCTLVLGIKAYIREFNVGPLRYILSRRIFHKILPGYMHKLVKILKAIYIIHATTFCPGVSSESDISDIFRPRKELLKTSLLGFAWLLMV